MALVQKSPMTQKMLRRHRQCPGKGSFKRALRHANVPADSSQTAAPPHRTNLPNQRFDGILLVAAKLFEQKPLNAPDALGHRAPSRDRFFDDHRLPAPDVGGRDHLIRKLAHRCAKKWHAPHGENRTEMNPAGTAGWNSMKLRVCKMTALAGRRPNSAFPYRMSNGVP